MRRFANDEVVVGGRAPVQRRGRHLVGVPPLSRSEPVRDLFVHAKYLFLEAIGDGWPWGRWLQWFQRMTMSKGAGPSNEERHCADADGDHRFSYDEGSQRRHNHEEAGHDDDCRLGREEMFRCWAHCSLQMDATPS